MALGSLLFLAELVLPAMGIILGLGLVAVVAGAGLAFWNLNDPFVQHYLGYVLVVVIPLLAFGAYGFKVTFKTLKQPVESPEERYLGAVGRLTHPCSPNQQGKVKVLGEVHNAELAPTQTAELPWGSTVKVVGIAQASPLVLEVEAS
jgi:membrane-bound ClpP family serine protease